MLPKKLYIYIVNLTNLCNAINKMLTKFQHNLEQAMHSTVSLYNFPKLCVRENWTNDMNKFGNAYLYVWCSKHRRACTNEKDDEFGKNCPKLSFAF